MSTCSPVTRSESLVTSPPPKGRVVSGDGLSTGSQSNQRKRGTATADARRGTTPPNTEYAHSRTLARSDQRAPNSNPHAVNPGERGRAAERRVAASPPRGCLPRAPRLRHACGLRMPQTTDPLRRGWHWRPEPEGRIMVFWPPRQRSRSSLQWR